MAKQIEGRSTDAIPRRSVLGLAAVLFCGACAQTAASASPVVVDVSVVDRSTGAVLPTHASAGRTYVAGSPGVRYSLRLQNRTAGRVLAVVSVDGVNVISGESADVSQGGYVLQPYQTADINGWRKNMNEVAAFEFAALSDSYAARTGRPANVGVIGVAAYEERPAPPRPRPPSPAVAPEARLSRDGRAGDASAAERALGAAEASAAQGRATPGRTDQHSPELSRGLSALAPTERLGTGHGQREWDAAAQTHFVRATRSPHSVVTIAYDSHANLVAAGIIVPSQPASWAANPFPSWRDRQVGFVPDPPRP